LSEAPEPSNRKFLLHQNSRLEVLKATWQRCRVHLVRNALAFANYWTATGNAQASRSAV
jgi:hypothetical protein